MTTPDPLLERLRRLPRPTLDDVAAARTLARAEATFASAPARRAEAATRSGWARWTMPAALALWGALYSWGAVRALGRLYPAAPATPAVASNHRGPSGFDAGAQFMLNAMSKVSARTTTTMTSVPLLPDTLLATSRSVAVPVWSEVSSDMDPSMQVVACEPRLPNVRFGAGRDTIAAPRAAQPACAPLRSRARAPSGWARRRSGA